jgi:hypothetical protein
MDITIYITLNIKIMGKTIVAFNEAPSMDLKQKLSIIQFEFKAKKTSYNKFGNYYFRSAESILEALKPMNEKYKVYFTVNERLVNANPPIMESVATIWDCESQDRIDCSAVVGVDLEQKGMATPQRYGSTSSYGKKYALGNLLLIDDTADPDATNKHEKDQSKPLLVEHTEAYNKALDYLAGGGTIDTIEKKYLLTKEVKEKLLR